MSKQSKKTAMLTKVQLGVIASGLLPAMQPVFAESDESQTTDNLVQDNAQAIITGTPTMRALNDTGITTCANNNRSDLKCKVKNFPRQDAEYGRDKTNNDNRDGYAGFSFTKLDAQGKKLPASAKSWSCVRDNVTGLVWEIKTYDDELRYSYWTYSWYNPDASTNGGNAGTQNGGKCGGGISCDTASYVAAVNAQGLCGAKDWRLPAVRELMSIVDRDQFRPAIETYYFPDTGDWDSFWTSSPSVVCWGDLSCAWYVSFYNGNVYGDYKGTAGQVRLVRGGK